MIFGVTLRAFAFDVTIRQKHILYRIVKLFDHFAGDEAGCFEFAINILRQLVIFNAVGGMPVIEGDMKSIQILLTA